jgi:hypothetical protein
MKRIFAAILAVLSVTAAMTTSVFAGFEEVRGEKYYYLEDGTLIKGRAQINGDYYYFSAKDGKMLHGATYKIGEKYYTFGEDGKQLGNTLTPAPAKDYGIAETDTGKVLTVYAWNNEIEDLLRNHYFPEHPLPEGVVVEFITTPSEDYEFYVERNFGMNADIDIFLSETDNLYLMQNYAVPLSELGLKNADLADSYKYTYQITSDEYGRVLGFPAFGAQGVLTYRRSIAKEVLGTDDPSKVAAYVKDFAALGKTAALMDKAGYYTFGSHNELIRMFNADNKTSLIKDGKLTIPNSWKEWAELSKDYFSKDRFASDGMWSYSWAKSIEDGNTFAYAGPSWLVNYSILPNDSKDSGDWAITTPPVDYYWGSTILSVAENSDNAHLAYDIITGIALDKDFQEKTYANEESNFFGYTPTLKSVTKALAESDYKDERLGGQNPYAVYDKAAQMINIYPENLWVRDEMYYSYDAAMTDYINDFISYETALERFYRVVNAVFPEMEIAE